MGIVKRINTALSVIILVACVGAWLLFGWQGTGWKSLAIPTGSMRPDIPPGSLVFVHRVPTSSLKVGDVITHTNPNEPKVTISHRIIKVYKIDSTVPAFVTKGDANKTADTPIVGGQVIGKVVWHVPEAGWALLDAKKPIVILPIIYLAALLLMIEEIQRLSAYYKLSIPYRAPGFAGHDAEKAAPSTLSRRAKLGTALTVIFVLVGAAAGPSAFALLKSNTVTLANNRISVAPGKGGGTCSGGTNNITVNNTTTQTATSGNVKSTGGGNATSGSASNSSSTSVNINVSNC